MTTLSLVPDTTTTDVWVTGVKKLQRVLPPKGFPMDRWTLVCLHCARLLEQYGGDLRRLAWSAEDAFSAHPDAPDHFQRRRLLSW